MRHLLTTTVIATVLASVVYIASNGKDANAELPKAEVQAIVKDYLLTNPQVVVDALTAYQENQAKEAEQQAKKGIQENTTALFNYPNTPTVGPADADIVIAEFFDYHCGYCKHMLPVVTKLLAEDKKIRFVFHEMPILSKDSRLASKAALAVYRLNPDKYFEYHTQLMGSSGQYTEESVTEMAAKLGVDKAKFTAMLKDKTLDETLKNSSTAARAIGISGTPAFVIGDELIPGASSFEDIKKIIEQQRKK